MADLRKTCFCIKDLLSFEGRWVISFPNGSFGTELISKDGHIYDGSDNYEYTEQDIAQISCYDEDAGITYKRIA